MTAYQTWIQNMLDHKTALDLEVLKDTATALHAATIESVDKGIADGAEEDVQERLFTIATALECYRDVIADALAQHPDAVKLAPAAAGA